MPLPPGLDPDTADRLLDGRILPDDAPPDLGEVTALLSALRAPAADDTLPVDRVGAVHVLTHRPAAVAVQVRSFSRWSRRTLAIGAGIVCFGGAVGAAAATGVLPGIQDDTPRTTSTTVVASTGPAAITGAGDGAADDPGDGAGNGADPGADPSTTTSASPTTSTTVAPTPDPAPVAGGVGPDPTGPARAGLCQAFGARTTPPGKSVAAARLAETAAAAGQSVAEFCGDGTTGTTVAPTTTAAPGRSGDAPGRQGTAGKPATTPSSQGSATGNANGTVKANPNAAAKANPNSGRGNP